MSELLTRLGMFDRMCVNVQRIISYIHVFIDYSFKKNVLFVTKNDEVFAFGNNYCGVLGVGHNNIVEEPEELPELKEGKINEFFTKGEDFVLALSSDNKLFAWGCNCDGQLGRGFISSSNEYLKPKEIVFFRGKPKIKQICCTGKQSIVLLEDKSVYFWGDNNNGFFGIENGFLCLEPKLLKILNNLDVETMDCYYFCYFTISEKNTVYSWGENYYYQLGHVFEGLIKTPSLIKSLSDVDIIDIKCWSDLENAIEKQTQYLTYFLSSDGKIFFCGKYEEIEQIEPKLIKFDENFRRLENVRNKIIALSENNIVFEFNGIDIKETEFNLVQEYSVEKYQITPGTIMGRKKFSNIREKLMIGKGTFAKVFKIKLDKEYFALKQEKINSRDIDDIREVEILKQLKNQFIVQLYDYWIENEENYHFIYIQMELCDETLKQVMKNNEELVKFSIADYLVFFEIFKQCLKALRYLHSREPKIIHRDIKPTNILVKYYNKSAKIKLCDFGLAKFIEFEAQTNTQNVGTKLYMAPEVMRGHNYDQKVDIYSLGLTMEELFDFERIKEAPVSMTHILNELKEYIEEKMTHLRPAKRPPCDEIISFLKKIITRQKLEIDNLKNERSHEEIYKFLNIIESKRTYIGENGSEASSSVIFKNC